jgi:hypothetical protein
MTWRPAISKSVRFEILRRDNFACRYCGTPAPKAELHIDHVVPVALGGTNDPSNLTAACTDCNAGKSDLAPPGEIVRQVRRDEADHLRARGMPVVACIYCSIPQLVEPEDDTPDHLRDCIDCNEVIVYSYEQGMGVDMSHRKPPRLMK